MSVNLYKDGELQVLAGASEIPRWSGTQAEWNSLDKSTLADGTYVEITDDLADLQSIFSAWEDITSDCTIEFGGDSSGNKKTDYVIYNKYLRKYRYKGTFTIGHSVGRTIRLTDTKRRASMVNSFITGSVNIEGGSKAGAEFTTYRKNGDNVTVQFYNRNSNTDWDSCELFFEVDCSQIYSLK